MIHVLTEDWSIHCINYMMWVKSASCLLVWYSFWKSKELISIVEFIQSLFAHNLARHRMSVYVLHKHIS